mmetsp:Transcript_4410/g.12678  ORF Transcript_4410/g.12678 Transcript_4410/m.12678 type:complete len:100 (+) Transcript_4410:281-580(+)
MWIWILILIEFAVKESVNDVYLVTYYRTSTATRSFFVSNSVLCIALSVRYGNDGMGWDEMRWDPMQSPSMPSCHPIRNFDSQNGSIDLIEIDRWNRMNY